MTPILLIAVNFVREQRWPILALLLWIIGLSTLTFSWKGHVQQQDLLSVLQLVGFYVLAFGLFFGGSALRNDLKSRRILAVLSKGITRGQYLAGLLFGIVIAVALFSCGLGIAAFLPELPLHMGQIVSLSLGLFSASLVCASVALLFSVFMPPLPATICTVLALGLPAMFGLIQDSQWMDWISPYAVFNNLLTITESANGPGWSAIGAGFVETAVIWAAATWIFSRKDVAVAVE